MNTHPSEQLLRYLDGSLTEKELEKLQGELKQSPELQAKLAELESIHRFLEKKSRLEMPSKNFTQRVMDRLDTLPQTSFISPRNGLYLLVGILVASGMLVMILSSGALNNMTTTLSVENPISNQNLLDISKVSLPIDIKLVIKVIIFINLALAFVMLDRTILRPLFRQRSETW